MNQIDFEYLGNEYVIIFNSEYGPNKIIVRGVYNSDLIISIKGEKIVWGTNYGFLTRDLELVIEKYFYKYIKNIIFA